MTNLVSWLVTNVAKLVRIDLMVTNMASWLTIYLLLMVDLLMMRVVMTLMDVVKICMKF